MTKVPDPQRILFPLCEVLEAAGYGPTRQLAMIIGQFARMSDGHRKGLECISVIRNFPVDPMGSQLEGELDAILGTNSPGEAK